MADEPRLCPFCGGQAHHTLGARQIRILDRVQCLSCFAEIEGTYDPNSALIKWNAGPAPETAFAYVHPEVRVTRVGGLLHVTPRPAQGVDPITGLAFPRPALLVRWLEGHEAGQFTVEADTELEDFDGDEGWRGYYKEEDVQALHRLVREGMTQAASLERTVARLQALLKLRTEQLAALGGDK